MVVWIEAQPNKFFILLMSWNYTFFFLVNLQFHQNIYIKKYVS